MIQPLTIEPPADDPREAFVEALPVEQLDILVSMGERAAREGDIPRFDPGAAVFHWKKLYEMGIGRIFVAWSKGEPAGAFGAVLAADLYTGDTIATEAFFYVYPEHRSFKTMRSLWEAYDAWSESKGVVRQYLSAHWGPHERLSRYYSRQGYEPKSVEYERDMR